MKKLSLLAIVCVVIFSGTVLAQTQTPDQAYFDEQFNKLGKAVGEVKGDTEMIKGILGTVFEGTVPQGGTLTHLCNENGWNLLVLMGHNGIENPNQVAAGTTFAYPQTAEELQLALKKGKPLHDAWLAKQSTTFRVNQIRVDTAEIDRLNVRAAHVKDQLKIKNMEIDQLKVRLAEIQEQLKVKQVEIDQLNVKQANLKQVNIDQLRVKDVKIENLEIENLRIKKALIDKLRIKQLEVDNLKDLLRQANARIGELGEKRRFKVGVGAGSGLSFADTESCDEKPFEIKGFWKKLRDQYGVGSIFMEVKDRAHKDSSIRYKGVANMLGKQWGYPSCSAKDYYGHKPSTAELAKLIPEGKKLTPVHFKDGGGEHNTIKVYLIE